MKKSLAILLCILLVFSCTSCFAEIHPWISPIVNLQSHNMQDMACETTIKVGMSIANIIAAANTLSSMTVQEQANAQMVVQMLDKPISIFLDALRLEIRTDGRTNVLTAMLGENEIADLVCSVDEEGRIHAVTDLLPSFMFELDMNSILGADSGIADIAASITSVQEALPLLSDEVIDAALDAPYAYILGLLNGKENVTLSAADFELLDNAYAKEHSFWQGNNGKLSIIAEQFLSYLALLSGQTDPEQIAEEQRINGVFWLFNENTIGTYEISVSDGQAQICHLYADPKARGGQVMETVTAAPRFLMIDQNSTSVATNNMKMTLDARQDNLISIRNATSNTSCWINITRNSTCGMVSGSFQLSSQDEVSGYTFQMNLPYDQPTMEFAIALVNNEYPIMSLTESTVYYQGTIDPIDEKAYRKVTLHPDQEELLSQEDADAISQEVQTVLLPKIQDIFTNKMPEGTEILPTLFGAS